MISVGNNLLRQPVIRVEVYLLEITSLMAEHSKKVSITVDHVTLHQSKHSGFRKMPASNARRWPEGDVVGDECELRTLAIEDPSER